MQYERVEGGAAVVAALIGEKNGLFIKNLNRPDPKWKLIAETNKPGESILHTLLSGLAEEAGLKDIKTELGQDGKIARFNDPRIKRVVQFGEPEYIRSKVPHYRHFFGVMTTDEVIHGLSGAHHHIEEPDGRGGIETEHIETMEFPLAMLDNIPNLLRQHAELIRSIPGKVATEVGV
jgi:hypothetical protein